MRWREREKRRKGKECKVSEVRVERKKGREE